MRSLLPRLAAVAATFALLAACSVPDDSQVKVIDRDQLPWNLSAAATTSSTTTSTTTTVVRTIPPAEAPPPTYGPPLPTLPPLVPDPVRLYFVVGDSMAEITRVLPTQPDLMDLVILLSVGPMPSERPFGARTALEVDDVEQVFLRAGTLTVDLAPKFRDLPAAEQRRAIAQLVLTFTTRGGVGQVTFTASGRRYEVPRANGSFGAATVSRDDYASMLLPAPSTIPTTTVNSGPPSERTPTVAPTTRRGS